MTTALCGDERVSKRSRKRPRKPAIDEQLVRRFEELRAREIQFIPSQDFRAESQGGESNEQLLAEPLGRASRPPRDLPSHLARLCEVDLLTKEQERAMFRSMNYLKFRAAALRAQLDTVPADPRALDDLERLLDGGDRIRDQLIQANMRLAISVVKKFVSPRRSFDEMLSDGIYSLMQAVEKFDYERGFRFSTYAYRALARNAYRKMQEERKESARLAQGEDETHEIPDRETTSSLDERTWGRLRGALTTLLQRLDRRERLIVRSRYALGPHRNVKTFQSLADKLGLSKERVRQLEQRAVAKLRRWSAEMQVFV